jgi:pimeloyl-ACP methyl ester carboxylesterase
MFRRDSAALLIAAALPFTQPDSVAAQPASPDAFEGTGTPLRFADVQLRTGVRLRYAEQGDPQGEAVILLHGLTDSWFSFSRILPLLPSSLHVFALDQRGQGDSDQPASGYTMADLGDDVLAFMDTMRLREATIVGHSMGSFVAQRVAVTAPERVRRLILLGSATTGNTDVVRAVKEEVASLPASMPRTFLRDFQYSTIHAPVPDAFMNRAIDESAKVPSRVAGALLDGLLASGDSARLAGIRVPTLIIRGEHDAIFPRSESLRLRESIAGSELRMYPDVGHAAHWEVPEQVVRDLLSFFERRGVRD